MLVLEQASTGCPPLSRDGEFKSLPGSRNFLDILLLVVLQDPACSLAPGDYPVKSVTHGGSKQGHIVGTAHN